MVLAPKVGPYIKANPNFFTGKLDRDFIGKINRDKTPTCLTLSGWLLALDRYPVFPNSTSILSVPADMRNPLVSMSICPLFV